MPGFGILRQRVLRRIRALVRRAAVERELDDELRFHLEMEAEYHMRHGLDPEEARLAALREFGGMTRTKEEAREARGVGALDDLGRDVRFASRSLRRTPVYTIVALLTIALGIGVTTAVFSVVDGVLLRPLPYPQPERLVRLYERNERYPRNQWAGANFNDVRPNAKSFSRMAFYSAWNSTILGGNEPRRARTAAVSTEFFEVLGVRPLRGRALDAGDGTVGGAQVAIVSHAFWQSALGADSAFAQRSLQLGNESYPIVGVMPPGFAYPAGVDVWFSAADANPHRTAHNWSVIGRLAPGATVASASAEVDAILARRKAEFGKAMDAEGVTIVALHEALAATSRTTLLILFGAVACVLLVVCVNLASANLARAESRQRELAVRTALGASRFRLVRQILTENLLLAMVGGAFGAGLAVLLTRLLVNAGGGAIPPFADVRVDGRVLVFGAVVSLLTGVLIGLGPALQTTTDLRGAIGGAAASPGARRLRSRALLIGGEVALAFALLTGAGLLIRSMQRVLGQHSGFDVDGIVTADIALPRTTYNDSLVIAGFYDRLLPELRAIAGVQSVGLIDQIPLGGSSANSSLHVDGSEELTAEAAYRIVDSTYFATLGIPLMRGRRFTAADRMGAPHVTIINETMAKKLWPNADALGHRIRPPGMDLHGKEWLTIVGIVGDVRHNGLEIDPEPEMYVHYVQRPERLPEGASVVIRTGAAAEQISSTVRERIRALDANVPVRMSTMAELMTTSTASRRFSTLVLSGFAALALLLSALGIYGVLAYSVAQRQREIGVRMALGAHHGVVRRMVLRDAMRAVLPGLVAGALLAVALAGVLRSLLFGVGTADAASYVGAAVTLAAVALLASWIPARRATRVDPLIAIRAE
jgi:putative ABC transport system permease protein